MHFFHSRPPVNIDKYGKEDEVPIMQSNEFERDEFPMRFPLQNTQRNSEAFPLRPLNERLVKIKILCAIE